MRRHQELDWHTQCSAQQREQCDIIRRTDVRRLYAARAARRARNERIARLGCFLIPLVLVYVIHLVW